MKRQCFVATLAAWDHVLEPVRDFGEARITHSGVLLSGDVCRRKKGQAINVVLDAERSVKLDYRQLQGSGRRLIKGEQPDSRRRKACRGLLFGDPRETGGWPLATVTHRAV